MKQKLFTTVATAMILSSLAVSAIGSTVHASKKNEQSTMSINRSVYSSTDDTARSAIAQKMKRD